MRPPGVIFHGAAGDPRSFAPRDLLPTSISYMPQADAADTKLRRSHTIHY